MKDSEFLKSEFLILEFHEYIPWGLCIIQVWGPQIQCFLEWGWPTSPQQHLALPTSEGTWVLTQPMSQEIPQRVHFIPERWTGSWRLLQFQVQTVKTEALGPLVGRMSPWRFSPTYQVALLEGVFCWTPLPGESGTVKYWSLGIIYA